MPFLFVPDWQMQEENKMQGSNDGSVNLAEGPAQVRLSEAIRKRMEDYGESERAAELQLVQTEAGLELWNSARAERLAFSERMP